MTNNTKEKCAQELADRHGRQVSHRFERMLENREQANGKSLSNKEVEDLKNRFDDEIYAEILRKGGK
jgi:hypothetical protein